MVLYRPWLPGLRAQSLQIVYSAHALASRGHTVRIHYRPTGGDPLAPFGLSPCPTLQLVPLPRRSSAAGLAMRWHALRWKGRFLARSKRLARDLLRMRRAHVVLEAHELDSHIDPGSRALEDEVFSGVRSVISNCEGVAAAVPVPSTVIHNAGVVRPATRGRGWVYAGSLSPEKDLETVARAARGLGGVDVLGPAPPERWTHLQRLAGGHLRWRGPVAPRDLPARLQQYRAGIVSLGTGIFGREFTSPLKAWSCIGVGLPYVGADLPSLHRIGPFSPYVPGDPLSLIQATRHLVAPRTPRSWHERAAEVEAVLA